MKNTLQLNIDVNIEPDEDRIVALASVRDHAIPPLPLLWIPRELFKEELAEKMMELAVDLAQNVGAMIAGDNPNVSLRVEGDTFVREPEPKKGAAPAPLSPEFAIEGRVDDGVLVMYCTRFRDVVCEPGTTTPLMTMPAEFMAVKEVRDSVGAMLGAIGRHVLNTFSEDDFREAKAESERNRPPKGPLQ